AHDLRDGKTFPLAGVPIEERYDLVVVGGGISGLASAWFYRRANPRARILVLDNLDDFGGHAKRNEFRLDQHLLIGYGGSESMQSPKALYSNVAKGLLKGLGVDIARFETAFERKFYPSLRLSRGVFFARETFGRDVLAVGDPTSVVADDLSRSLLNAKPLPDFVAQFPISAEGKAQLIALYQQRKDPLAGKSQAEKIDVLRRTSYRDYLIKVCGCNTEVADCFQGRTLDFFAVGCDAVSASDARDAGYPGFDALGLPAVNNPERSEPYIYHFPDGNAPLARLLGRALIPTAAPGVTMDDVVLAPFDYTALDVDDSPVRILLDRTCVNVRNTADSADLAFPEWQAAPRCRRACGAGLLPHDHTLSDAGAAAGAGGGAGQERQGAARLQQRAGAQLASLGEARRARDRGADVDPQTRQARLSRESRQLPASARSGRAGSYPHDLRSGRAWPRCPHPVQVRPLEASVDGIRRFREGHPRRARPDARPWRLCQLPRHRGDHGEPLVARLQLRGELAVRRRRLRDRGAGGGAPEGR